MNKRLLIALLLSASSLYSACENDMESIHKIAPAKEINVERISQVETYYSDYGAIKAKLTAPELDVYQSNEPYKELPKGLSLTFYKEDFTEDGKLTALYGINYEGRNTIIVRRNVVVVNVKGEQLNTEELIWDMNKHILFTDKFVVINTGDEQIKGFGMEAREDFTNYKIKKVTGVVKVKDEALK